VQSVRNSALRIGQSCANGPIAGSRFFSTVAVDLAFNRPRQLNWTPTPLNAMLPTLLTVISPVVLPSTPSSSDQKLVRSTQSVPISSWPRSNEASPQTDEPCRMGFSIAVFPGVWWYLRHNGYMNIA
jgi:hypothetical protein